MQDAERLPDSPVFAALNARLEARLAARREALAQQFPVGAREWALLVPIWTAPLARAAGFPGADAPTGSPEQEQATSILEQLVAAGLLVVVKPDPLPDGTALPRLYMRMDSAYSDLLAEYLARPEGSGELCRWIGQVGRGVVSGSRELLAKQPVSPSEAGEITPWVIRAGPGVMSGELQDVAVPTTTLLWACLASGADQAGKSAEIYRALVEPLLERQGSPDINGATNWKTAAEPLADLLTRNLDRSLELALQQTGRRLELLYRESLDRAHLKHFLDREELTAAYKELISGPDDRWALHLVGAGGVGKTMFIRHLTANLARPPEFVTARIDFDYLSADYPVRAPSLLLWAFAQELMAYANADLRSFFASIEVTMREFHGALADGRVSGRPTQHPSFQDLVRKYIEAFRELPGRLLLIVDTCEELARRYAAGEQSDDEPETIRETFRILRALHDGPDTLLDDQAQPHDGIPSLRVIFAGRWLLAGAGHGWRAKDAPGATRPFLRLHEIQGFTVGKAPDYSGEARTYLEAEQVTPKLVVPVIRRVRERPPASAVILADAPARANRSAKQEWRCNPYDLRLYAEWATDEPAPSPTAIKQAGPLQYVETRILRRLKSREVSDILPAVALLGHIDRDLLRNIARVEGGAVDELYAQLRRQEWIQQRRVSVDIPDADSAVLDLDPPMQRRLLAYYRERPSNLQALAQRSADALIRRTLEADLGGLDWSIVDATLRTLEHLDPVRAAGWWQRFEARVLEERGPEWAGRITEALVAEDGAAGPAGKGREDAESQLRPAVLALHASALLHGGARGRVQGVWREVVATAARAPTPSMSVRLARLAQAGLISSTRAFGEAPAPEQVAQLWEEISGPPGRDIGPQEAAGFLAAVEALVEQAELLVDDHGAYAAALALLEAGEDKPLGPLRLYAYLDEARAAWGTPANSLVAYAAILAARALRLSGDLAGAARLLAPPRPALREAGVWLAWRPPADLEARCALEELRLLFPAIVGAADVLPASLQVLAEGTPQTLDGDRLASARLQLLLDARTLRPDELTPVRRLIESGWSSGVAPVECRAHAVTPPLMVSAAEALAAAGLVDEALATLRSLVKSRAKASGDAVRHAERALLRLVRRWRLDIRSEGGGTLLKGADQAEDLGLIWAAQAFSGAPEQRRMVPPRLTGPALHGWLHQAWRTMRIGRRADAEAALKWVYSHLAPEVAEAAGPPEAGLAQLQLDLHEAAQALRPWGLELSPLPDMPGPSGWWSAHPAEPEAALRIALRARALTAGALTIDDPTLRSLAARLGARRAAEVALDEGELWMLLRPSDTAEGIVTASRDWFEACDDHLGALHAATTHALACARAGSDEGMARALGRARSSYERLLPTLATPTRPPSWSDLEELVRQGGGGADRARPGPLGWSPWLLRLIACLTWHRARHESGIDTTWLTTWAASTYGVTYGGESSGLPVDLAGWLDVDLAGWLNVAALPFDVPSTQPAQEDPKQAHEAGSLTLGSAPLELRVAELNRLLLRIRPVDQPEVSFVGSDNLSNVEATLVMQPGLLVQLEVAGTYSAGGEPQPIFAASLRTPGQAPYAELAAQLSDAARRDLASILTAPRPTPLEVVIEAAEGLEGPCWEALALAEPSMPLEGAWLLRRPPDPVPLRPPVPGPLRIVSVAPTRLAQSVVRGSQSRLGDLMDVVELFREIRGPGQLQGSVKILHLIGTGASLGQGLALRLAGGESGPAESPSQTSPLRSVFGTTSSGPANLAAESGLVLPHEIRLMCPDLVLCVLQSDPVRAAGRRRSRDRYDAALLRRLAAELQRQGVPIVVTLPPLDLSLAARALERFLDSLVRSESLQESVTHVRLLAGGRSPESASSDDPGSSEDTWERALDVGVFVVDGWEQYVLRQGAK